MFASEREIVKNFLNKNFPGVEIKELANTVPFEFTWEVKIKQKLDHHNKSRGSFYQRFILHHRGLNQANVLVTEGYNVTARIYEGTMILLANQIAVEYRFYDESKPLTMEWQYLNHDQALRDLYYIEKKLKKLYKKKWCATGISKGGTTCVLYKTKYPKMVNAVISYVGPFPNAQEDQRTIDHYTKKIGNESCRKKIKRFQNAILDHRPELIIKLDSIAQSESTSFPIGVNKVIDYAALEYPFSFWQWGYGCENIPDQSASAQEIFDHVEQVVDFNYYDEKQCDQFLPAYYQFMTEFGYYGFDTSGLVSKLSSRTYSNKDFCPKNVDLTYNPKYMERMTSKASKKCNNTIFIYGELDTWTACALEPSAKTNAIKYVIKNSGHTSRIKNLSLEQKINISKLLSQWMDTPVAELKSK